MTEITYAYMDDTTHRTATVDVDETEAAQAAVEALDAQWLETNWCYWDDASRSWYAASRAALIELGAGLLAGHPLHAVYSVWCSLHPAEEIRER